MIERYGEPTRVGIESAKAAQEKMSPAERKAFQETQGKELHKLEEALAGALRNGVNPGSEAVDLLIARHRAWVAAMWGRPCSVARYSGLADLYLAHPDFVARYEQIEKGFAEYLASAMKLHAVRWENVATGDQSA